MSAISVKNLTFAYEGSYDNIFENVSFQIDSSWKLGFTGRNGRGKTTFLKLLSGELHYQGQIEASVTFEYFPFEIKQEDWQVEAVALSVNPELETWQLVRELSYLELGAEVLNKPFATLSEGEKTKVLLAVLFLKPHNFLLIDEPTNHLDIHGRAVMAKYLQKKQGFILVSHDKAFLDQCIDHVLSIEKTSIDIQRGNFSSLLQNKAYQDQFELAENEKLLKDIDRLSKSAKRTAGWSDQIERSKYGSGPVDKGFIGHKSAKMMKRAKAIEKRREAAISDKMKLLKNIELVDDLELRPLNDKKGHLLTLENFKLSYGEHIIQEQLAFEISQGERIAIVGANGSGKSSLLHAILEHLGLQKSNCQHSGRVTIQSGLVVSYVSQSTKHLQGDVKTFCQSQAVEESLLKSLLIKLDFNRLQFEKDIADWSEGQKKKLLIATSLSQRAHLYIWDEPLNYIDILSRVQIETMINAYQPTMIFVEHDQDFIDEVATGQLHLY